jgi:hypothetical protein
MGAKTRDEDAPLPQKTPLESLIYIPREQILPVKHSFPFPAGQ